MLSVDELIELEILTRGLVGSLEKEIAEADAHLAPPAQLDGTEGRLSRQDSMIHHEISKNAQHRRIRRLAALREALERMDEGSYGGCRNCGGAISHERLRVQPEALLCDHCAGGKPLHARAD